jgi:hypothetical protein
MEPTSGLLSSETRQLNFALLILRLASLFRCFITAAVFFLASLADRNR